MKNPTLLNIKIRGFSPETYSNAAMPKKIKLREKLRIDIGDDLLSCQKRCKSAGKLSLKACFYLDSHGKNNIPQDLDNLLKILLDVLQDHMDKQRKHEGLGITSNDAQIYHVDCTKRAVSNRDEEGIDVDLFSFCQSNSDRC